MPFFNKITVIMAVLWLLTTPCPPGQAATPMDEYRIKAAFLYNFTRFTVWPPGSLPENNAPLLIGVLSRDTSPYWTADLESRTVRGHAIVVSHLRLPEEVGDRYHVVFIHHSMKDHASEIVRRLQHRPVLLVGDELSAADWGGTLNFLKINNKIHFEINLEALRDNGLKISSEMLKLGRNVKDIDETK